MKCDVLGIKELESLKFDWTFGDLGLMAGHCNATGTCDNRPISGPQKNFLTNAEDSSFEELEKAHKIIEKYGLLRE